MCTRLYSPKYTFLLQLYFLCQRRQEADGKDDYVKTRKETERTDASTPCFLCTFLPARRCASACNSDRNVSVRLSDTSRYCAKTKKASVMISSPSGSPMILVFWRQISSPNSKGFPRVGASKKGGVGKVSHFLSLSLNISKTVTDTTIHCAHEKTIEP